MRRLLRPLAHVTGGLILLFMFMGIGLGLERSYKPDAPPRRSCGEGLGGTDVGVFARG